MEKDKLSELMGIVDGLARSIREYDSHFNMKCEKEHACVLAGFRDTAFGILFSLFVQNHIPSGEFHRKLHEINSSLYKKID